MTNEQQQIAIAQACGWTLIEKSYGDDLTTVGVAPDSRVRTQLPDYLNDLNAMHEAVMSQNWPLSGRITYRRNLQDIVSRDKGVDNLIHYGECINATAAQRAEAFLRTKGLWKCIGSK